VQAGLGLAAEAGSGPAAIQLTMVLSHLVKCCLSEAIDRMHGRGRIQAAKRKGVVGIFSSTCDCADDRLLHQGRVLRVQVGSNYCPEIWVWGNSHVTLACLSLSYPGMTWKGEEPGAEGCRNQGALPVRWSQGQGDVYSRTGSDAWKRR